MDPSTETHGTTHWVPYAQHRPLSSFGLAQASSGLMLLLPQSPKCTYVCHSSWTLCFSQHPGCSEASEPSLQRVTPTAPHRHCSMNTDPHYTSHTLIPLHLTDTAPPSHGHYPPHTCFFKKLTIRSFPSHTLFYGRL